jgi:hypothetical protein
MQCPPRSSFCCWVCNKKHTHTNNKSNNKTKKGKGKKENEKEVYFFQCKVLQKERKEMK